MYGAWEFGDPWGVEAQGVDGCGGEAEAAPGASPPALHVICVQRGKKATSTALLCPVHDMDDDEAAQAAQTAADEGATMMCTVDWLRGRLLEADGQVWEAWEGHPYTTEAFAGKKGGREKRWCTRTGCVRALVRTEKGHRSKLPPCVESQIQEMYGVSEVGFLEESVCNQKRKTDEQV